MRSIDYFNSVWISVSRQRGKHNMMLSHWFNKSPAKDIWLSFDMRLIIVKGLDLNWLIKVTLEWWLLIRLILSYQELTLVDRYWYSISFHHDLIPSSLLLLGIDEHDGSEPIHQYLLLFIFFSKEIIPLVSRIIEQACLEALFTAPVLHVFVIWCSTWSFAESAVKVVRRMRERKVLIVEH